MRKKYVDPEYGEFTPITEKYFLQRIEPKHSECTMDGETIIDNKEDHIERVLCYTHKIDWFIRL